MNVILTVDSVKPPLTGIGRYSWELATRLGEQPGVGSCRLFDRGKWVSRPEDLLSRGGGFVVPMGSFTSRALRAAYRAVAPAWQAWVLRNETSALFHSTNFYLPRFPGQAVVTVHDLSILKFPEFHPPERVAHLKSVIPQVVGRADHLLTDSEYTRGEVLDTFGLPDERVTAVPLGVQVEFAPRGPAESAGVLGQWGLTHGAYSLCVATIEPRKNILGLIRAYRNLRSDLRKSFPLVLAGHKGWNSGEIHRAIEDAQSEGWLIYLGYVSDDDLPVLFAGTRLFIFPSWYEGYGLPVLQAMASGVPCVTSSASSLPEVADGTGWLIDPSRPDSLLDGIECGLTDESRREESIRRGLVLARERTWERCAKLTAEAYRKISD